MPETRRLIGAMLWCALWVHGVAAQAPARGPAIAAPPTPLPVIISIRDLAPREHRAQGFVLAAPGQVQVDAVGAEPRPRGDDAAPARWPAAAWILDAKTRQVVWDLRTAHTTIEANGLHRFTGPITLPAGVYELHYGSYPATSVSFGSGNLLQNIKTIIEKNKNEDGVRYTGPYVSDGLYRQFGITLRGAGRAAGFSELAAARKGDPSVLAMIHPVRHDAVERTAFSVSQATAITVIATGEMTADVNSDIGWIIDADTRHEVWRMSYAKSQAAGGASRNRIERTTLTLPAGRYVAYFTTNGADDPAEWTRMPPFDPDSWGLVLTAATTAARAAFKLIAWQPVPASGTLASITKVGDGESKTADFALAQPTNVRLYALGESTGDEMADYAWLVDMDSHRRIWTMKAKETVWAGGASKNREFDGVIPLPAGHYRLSYTTDDSHAFGDWNADAPVEPEYWGVSAWATTGKADGASLMPVISAARLKPVASIHHVGDNLNVQVGFRVEADGKYRIYAIGEGSGGGMQDYASIEDATTHRPVWTMRYAETGAAGGGEKNRQFDGTIDLKAGSYILRWRSDDSHSWGRWNTDAPDDPEGWGVTVSKATPGVPR